MKPTALSRLGSYLPMGSAILLLALGIVAQHRYGTMFLAVPTVILILLAIAQRLFASPITILAGFLAVAVNLDFFRFGNILTGDIILSTFLMYAVLVRLGMQKEPRLKTRVEKAYLIYLLAIIPSVLLSLDPAMSFKNYFRDVEYFLLLAFVIGLSPTQSERRMLVGTIIFASVIPIVLGFAGIILNIPAFYGDVAPLGTGEVVQRVSSTSSHPATFSQFMCMEATLTLAFIIQGRWFSRKLLVPLFLAQSYMLYLGYTRTTWGEFIICVCALAWLMGYRKQLISLVPASLLGLILFVPTFLTRWATATKADENNSLFVRFALWLKALSLYPQRPIFGSGPDTFIGYVSLGDYGAHNTWLKSLIETGALGLLTYVALIFVAWRSVTAKIRTAPRTDVLPVATLAVFIGFLVASWLGDVFEVPPVTVYLWVLIALVAAPQREEARVG